METVSQQPKNLTFAKSMQTNTPGKDAQPAQKAKLSSWHYLRELLEAVAALGIVVVIGIFLPATWLQSHFIFCVFFLIVFVIAIRYHAVTTYVLGLLVAGYYGFLLWQQFHPSQPFDIAQLSIEPFLLFVSGIIISEMLRAQQRQVSITKQQYIQKENFLQEIKQRYQDTQMLNSELEQELVGQAITLSTVNEKMARLWELQGREQYQAMLDVMMHAIHARFCALYMLHNGCMKLCASQEKGGFAYNNTIRLKLDVNDGFISRVIQTRQVYTIRDTLTGDQPAQRVIAMMAGPLLDQHNQVVGVVIVDDIPLVKFLPTTVRLFSSILHMISIALQTVTLAADEGVIVPLTLDEELVEDNAVTQIRARRALPAIKP